MKTAREPFVQPGGPRRWQVEGGLATIEVVGTAGRLRVSVQRGAIVVRGEGVPDRALSAVTVCR